MPGPQNAADPGLTPGQQEPSGGELLHVSQRGVSHVEHEANPRLGTLAEYVNALGDRLELRAVFKDQTVELSPPAGKQR